jgi:hypothetical protein
MAPLFVAVVLYVANDYLGARYYPKLSIWISLGIFLVGLVAFFAVWLSTPTWNEIDHLKDENNSKSK